MVRKYGCFMIDPPWPRGRGGLRKLTRPDQVRDVDFPTMPIPDIFDLLDREVFPLADDYHSVFMWGLDKLLTDGEQPMLDRGYRLHARFIWNKRNGVAPAFTVRYCHEYLSWFYKPKMLPVAHDRRGKYRTVFYERPREHARKPDYAYRMVSRLYPDVRRIDVFSREKRKGWDQFGNQKDYFSEHR